MISQYLLLNNYSAPFGTAGRRLMSTRTPLGRPTGAGRHRFGRSRGMGKWQSSFSRGGAPHHFSARNVKFIKVG